MPRLRIVAGPNGSGKSTLLDTLRHRLPEGSLGAYVNADEIERSLGLSGELDLDAFGIEVKQPQVARFFADEAAWIVPKRGSGAAEAVRVVHNRLSFGSHPIDSYVAAAVADLIRRLLLAGRRSFTFETVMSSPVKVAFLNEARAAGYRTYLYYIATADPDINVSRVANRVLRGGHAVPEHAIRSRYERSLDLLLPALRAATRAYVFDNSGAHVRHVLIAEKIETGEVELRAERVPPWFDDAVLDRLR